MLESISSEERSDQEATAEVTGSSSTARMGGIEDSAADDLATEDSQKLMKLTACRIPCMFPLLVS